MRPERFVAQHMSPNPGLLVLSIIGVGLLAALPTEAHHGTTQTKSYTMPSPGTNTLLCNSLLGLDGCDGIVNDCVSPEGIGGARFCNLDAPAPASAAVLVKDAVPTKTGVRTRVVDASGALLDEHRFCTNPNQPVTIPIPPGAAELQVLVSGVSSILGGCVAGPGTTGTITVAWASA